MIGQRRREVDTVSAFAAERRRPGAGEMMSDQPVHKGAHIHLQHGDTMLDVKCADDEPMTSCADLTLQMLDQLQGLKN